MKKTLLYPSAGNKDWKIAFQQFINDIDKFIFSDISYTKENILKFKKYFSEIGKIYTEELIGSFENEIQNIEFDDIKYRNIEAAYYKIDIKIKDIVKTVIFRKGFGQYALRELKNNSLYCFYHRGDSQGEGGSNVFYLGNRNSHHKPISRLFDLLITKLMPISLIVTDGSNTDSMSFKKFYREISSLDKETIIKNKMHKTVKIYGVNLKLIDVLDYRYNHTLVWIMEKEK